MGGQFVDDRLGERDRPRPVLLVLHGAERRHALVVPDELAVDGHLSANPVDAVVGEAQRFGDAGARAGAEDDERPVARGHGVDEVLDRLDG